MHILFDFHLFIMYIITMMKKICTRCKEEKPLEEFYKTTKSKDGRKPECKNCFNIYKKSHYIKNKKRLLKDMKQYNTKNKERISEYFKEYYEENKTKYLERNKEYSKENKQKTLEYAKKYYAENKQKIRKNQQEYYKTPQGKAVAARAAARRGELEKQVEKYLTHKDWSLIQRLQYNECACCHRAFNAKLTPCRDHIYPVIKGGPFIKENIQALCIECNSKKNTKYIDYRTKLHKYIIYTE